MRPSLALVMVLVGGCGVDEVVAPEQATPRAAPDGLAETITVHNRIPAVCAERRWDTLRPTSKDVDIAVVPTWQGAAVFQVPTAGGALTGFQIDGRGEILGDKQGTKLRSDHVFTSVAAGMADGRLVANVTAADDATVRITAISDDLLQTRELGVVDGSVASDTPIIRVRGARTTAVGGAAGMLATTFTSAWTQGAIEPFARDVPTGMSAASWGEDAMVAWSTDRSCTMSRIAANVTSVQPFACASPRVAASYPRQAAELVYEQGEHVLLADLDTTQANEISTLHTLGFGSSPRIAHDGTRFWGSYLSPTGDLVVGYLNDKASLTSVVLPGVHPTHDAYDLVMLANGIWVFSSDGAAVTAQKLCLVDE